MVIYNLYFALMKKLTLYPLYSHICFAEVFRNRKLCLVNSTIPSRKKLLFSILSMERDKITHNLTRISDLLTETMISENDCVLAAK